MPSPRPSTGPVSALPALPVLPLILLTALNLRPVASTVGPLLPDLQEDLRLDGALSGLLTSLPPLCFALFGPLAPVLSRRLGATNAIMAAMGVLAAGLLLRALAPGPWTFLLATLAAISGVAVANVLLPVLIGRFFPGRIARMTAMYTTAIGIAATLAAAVVVPLAGLLGGSWRWGLGIWALLAVAAAASALPCRDAASAPAARGRRLPPMWRSGTARGMAGYLAVNATTAYIAAGWLPRLFQDAGMSASTAGVLLAVVLGLIIPLTPLLPSVISRLPDQRPLVWVLCLSTLPACAGLALAPDVLPWLWAFLLGLSGAGFPLALTMINLRARTEEGVARLSSFAQSTGYLLAVPGPVLVGVLYQHTGSWDLPLALLAVLVAPQLYFGLRAARDVRVEDELGAPDAPAGEPGGPREKVTSPA